MLDRSAVELWLLRFSRSLLGLSGVGGPFNTSSSSWELTFSTLTNEGRDRGMRAVLKEGWDSKSSLKSKDGFLKSWGLGAGIGGVSTSSYKWLSNCETCSSLGFFTESRGAMEGFGASTGGLAYTLRGRGKGTEVSSFWLSKACILERMLRSLWREVMFSLWFSLVWFVCSPWMLTLLLRSLWGSELKTSKSSCRYLPEWASDVSTGQPFQLSCSGISGCTLTWLDGLRGFVLECGWGTGRVVEARSTLGWELGVDIRDLLFWSGWQGNDGRGGFFGCFAETVKDQTVSITNYGSHWFVYSQSCQYGLTSTGILVQLQWRAGIWMRHILL